MFQQQLAVACELAPHPKQRPERQEERRQKQEERQRKQEERQRRQEELLREKAAVRRRLEEAAAPAWEDYFPARQGQRARSNRQSEELVPKPVLMTMPSGSCEQLLVLESFRELSEASYRRAHYNY